MEAAPNTFEFEGKHVPLGNFWRLTQYRARNTCGNMMESLLGFCELAEEFSKLTAAEFLAYLEAAKDSAISEYREQWADIIRIAWQSPIHPSWRASLEEICTGKFDLNRFHEKTSTTAEPWGAWLTPANGTWA